jgi:hypothetical protein
MWIICCSSQTKYVVFDIDIFGTQKCHSKTKLDWLGVQTGSHTVANISEIKRKWAEEGLLIHF